MESLRKNPLARGKHPFFSVVVPLYNKKPYLNRSLGSILRQTFDDLEILVIDDGSTDGSGKAVASFHDKRIRLVSQKNAGVSAARNLGVALSRGRFVAFLDADDEWDPDYLSILKGLIMEFPGAGLYATNYRVHDGKRLLENPVRLAAGWRGRLKSFYRLIKGERLPFHTSSVCLPWEVARQTPFPAGIKAGEDIYVWFHAALNRPIAYLNQPHTVWYLETRESSHGVYFGPRYHLDWRVVGRRLEEKQGPLPADVERFITWCVLAQAKKMILQGHPADARGRLKTCSKKYFLGRQAALLGLAFFPSLLRRVALRLRRRPGSAVPLSPPSPPAPATPPIRQRTPFFSVVLPLYNKQDYIRSSVASVTGQSFGDFELIVVDDGSKDEGPRFVRTIADNRIRLISQRNAGVSAARNRGVAAARGRYVAFLDADDEWDRDYLAALKGMIEEFPGAGLYAANYWVHNGRQKMENPVPLPSGWRGRLHDYYDLCYYRRPPFCTDTVCLPTPLARRTPFPKGIKSGEDLLVWFKASLRRDTVYWNTPLATYNVAADSNTHTTYFGPSYHVDWLALGRRLRAERLLSLRAERYVVWASLIQVRKMISNGRRWEAWTQWWHCPKGFFPLYQFGLFLLLLLPVKKLSFPRLSLGKAAAVLRSPVPSDAPTGLRQPLPTVLGTEDRNRRNLAKGLLP